MTQQSEEKTLRDEFAMAALSGIVVSTDAYGVDEEVQAREAFKLADAMMEARKK